MRVQLVLWDQHDHRVEQLITILRNIGLADFAPYASLESFSLSDIDDTATLVIVHAANHSHRSTRAAQILKQNPNLRVVTVGPIDDSRFILDTLHHGADFYVDQDDLANELPRIIKRLVPDHAAQQLGPMYIVVGASGGCGASTIAVNLAAILANKQRECGLIDLHTHGGDSAALLDLKPAFTLEDVSSNESRLDRAMISKMLTKHTSGIRLLAAPRQSFQRDYASPTAVFNAIELCQSMLPTTVIDMQYPEDSLQRELLLRSERIYLTTRLSFAALRHARHLVELLDQLNIPRSKVNLIANCAGQPNDLLVEDAQQAIGLTVTQAIRYDPETINAANNVGVPVVLKSPDSLVAKDIVRIITPTMPTRSGLVCRVKQWLKTQSTDKRTAIPTQAMTKTQTRFAYEQ